MLYKAQKIRSRNLLKDLNIHFPKKNCIVFLFRRDPFLAEDLTVKMYPYFYFFSSECLYGIFYHIYTDAKTNAQFRIFFSMSFRSIKSFHSRESKETTRIPYVSKAYGESRAWDLNPRHSDYDSDVLTAELARRAFAPQRVFALQRAFWFL